MFVCLGDWQVCVCICVHLSLCVSFSGAFLFKLQTFLISGMDFYVGVLTGCGVTL